MGGLRQIHRRDRRGAKKDPQRGDRDIPGDPPGSLHLLSLGGEFFVDWNKQRLVLLRKENKPLEDASFYRPIRLLDTMGKLLEEMILKKLQGHMVGENGLSENQFGFRKGRPTVDAIQAVVDIATKARRGTGKRKGYCALISIDIRNHG